MDDVVLPRGPSFILAQPHGIHPIKETMIHASAHREDGATVERHAQAVFLLAVPVTTRPRGRPRIATKLALWPSL